MTIYENPYITNYAAIQAYPAKSAWKEPVTIGILSLLLLKLFGVETWTSYTTNIRQSGPCCIESINRINYFLHCFLWAFV